jgi:hypothetical protein
MRIFGSILVCLLLLAGLLLAAAIDGKWVVERKVERGGESFTITQTFDLKSDGSKLTGTVTTVFGQREPFTAEIRDGKVEGNKFSFVTVMSTPNGEFKSSYEGTVEGDMLKGTVTPGREGAESRPFEAHRK